MVGMIQKKKKKKKEQIWLLKTFTSIFDTDNVHYWYGTIMCDETL